MNDHAWRDKAACLTSDPEIFFPDPSDVDTALRAKGVCDTCPVISECRRFAIRTRQSDGIWGGLSKHGLKRLAESEGHACADCDTDIPKGLRFCADCRSARRARGQRAYDQNKKRTAA